MGDRILVEVEVTEHGSQLFRTDPEGLGLDISAALGERDEKFKNMTATNVSTERRYKGARVLTEENPL